MSKSPNNRAKKPATTPTLRLTGNRNIDKWYFVISVADLDPMLIDPGIWDERK
jgi:hypothetical protein